ncbi:MAG: UbiD family decarboxylase, partial [Chloroflexota bacterium]
KALDDIGELRVVEGADWDLEIGAISELMREQKGPSLLFDKVEGYPAGYRVAANLFGNPKQYCLPHGISSDMSDDEFVQWWRGKMKAYEPVPPVKVKDGPLMENVINGEAVNMFRFPAPKWHELDGGRYIGTGSCTICRDPDSGTVNLGTYRIMIHDEKTISFLVVPGKHGDVIRNKYWAKGQSCPVAVAFGQDPLLWTASTQYNWPWGSSEYDLAGYLRGEPVEVLEGPLTGLPLPARAEIVIEGEAPPPDVDARPEGPFGEWNGYYGSGAATEPVIRVKAIYHRNNPIIQGNPPYKPPLPHFPMPEHLLGQARTWNVLEANGVTDFKVGGPAASTKIKVISIKQRYAGHAAKAALIVAAHSYTMTFIIVVDDDIDPNNMDEVLWAMATRCDPQTSIDVVNNGWGSSLDPRITPEKKANHDYTSSFCIIYATRPFSWANEYPAVNRFSDEYRKKMSEKWKSLLSLWVNKP